MGLFGVKKLLAIGVGVLAMAMGASLRLTAPASPPPASASVQVAPTAPAGEMGHGRSRWQTIWTQTAPELTASAISAEGANVAWADSKGVIRRVDAAKGKTLWQTAPIIGVNDLRITSQGFVLAFARLNPGKPVVRILDANEGANRSALAPVDGAIWSVEVTADGRLAAVGTGSSSLYFIPVRTDAAWPGVATKMSGIPDTLAVASKEPLLFAGTWMDTGISVWGMDRLPRWRRRDRESDRMQAVCLSADGGTAVSASGIGAMRREARLDVWNARTGKLLWIENLDGFAPKAAVSADGQFIAVSYRQAAGGGGAGGAAQKIALFDRAGKRLFGDKGGHFFAPELVCLSADGVRLTVSDNEGNLWTLDRQGRTVSRQRPTLDPKTGKPCSILHLIATADGKNLLVYRSDSSLTLYRAAP